MRELRGISDRDIERLFDGEVVGDADLDQIATHLRNLRALSAQAPGDEVASRHVAAVIAAARTRAHGAAPRGAAPSVTASRGFMHRIRIAAARLAAAAVALTGATTGLAYAGVDLPGGAAERAVEAVLNVELPNQGESERKTSRSANAGAVANRVRAVIETWTGARGCEFGQAVSAAARDGDGGPGEDPCTKAGGAAATGGKATGEEKSAAGKARATAGRNKGAEKSAAGKATGAEKSGAGKAMADEKSSAGRATAEGRSSAGRSRAEENSAKGRETAENKASDGRATGEEKSAGGREKGGRP